MTEEQQQEFQEDLKIANSMTFEEWFAGGLGEHTKRIWKTFTDEQKVALVRDARIISDEIASLEDQLREESEYDH